MATGLVAQDDSRGRFFIDMGGPKAHVLLVMTKIKGMGSISWVGIAGN
jgi:hypothetical protein